MKWKQILHRDLIEIHNQAKYLYSQHQLPVVARAILPDGQVVSASNNDLYHAEEQLLLWNPISLIVNLEPCPACAFKILNSSVEYLFFCHYNEQYGAFGGKFLLSRLLPFSRKIKIYGGMETNTNWINDYFLRCRSYGNNL